MESFFQAVDILYRNAVARRLGLTCRACQVELPLNDAGLCVGCAAKERQAAQPTLSSRRPASLP